MFLNIYLTVWINSAQRWAGWRDQIQDAAAKRLEYTNMIQSSVSFWRGLTSLSAILEQNTGDIHSTVRWSHDGEFFFCFFFFHFFFFYICHWTTRQRKREKDHQQT